MYENLQEVFINEDRKPEAEESILSCPHASDKWHCIQDFMQEERLRIGLYRVDKSSEQDEDGFSDKPAIQIVTPSEKGVREFMKKHEKNAVLLILI